MEHLRSTGTALILMGTLAIFSGCSQTTSASLDKDEDIELINPRSEKDEDVELIKPRGEKAEDIDLVKPED